MTDNWWSDVGGQIVAGAVTSVVLAGLALFTQWGKRIVRFFVRGISRGWQALRSLRITTNSRIEAEIEAAVQAATAALTDSPDDDDEPRPLRPDEHEGWVFARAQEPRRWELRNQTPERAIVEAIMPIGTWPFDWEPSEFPLTLNPGESISMPARRLRNPAGALLPWMDAARANVLWEDSHGDQREDVIWVVD